MRHYSEIAIEITGDIQDMLNQFSRTQLLLGADNMERLANAKVAVFGIGGLAAMLWRHLQEAESDLL